MAQPTNQFQSPKAQSLSGRDWAAIQRGERHASLGAHKAHVQRARLFELDGRFVARYGMRLWSGLHNSRKLEQAL